VVPSTTNKLAAVEVTFVIFQDKDLSATIRRGAPLASKLNGNSSNAPKPRRESDPLRKYFKGAEARP
jgi:hypothetical protein